MSEGQDERDDTRPLTPEELDELATRIAEGEERGQDAVRRAFADVPFVEESVEDDPDGLKP